MPTYPRCSTPPAARALLYVVYRELRRLERQLDEKRQAMSRRGGRREEIRLAFALA